MKYFKKQKEIIPTFLSYIPEVIFHKGNCIQIQKKPDQQNQNKTRGKLKQVKTPVFFVPPKVKQNKNLKHNKPTPKKSIFQKLKH